MLGVLVPKAQRVACLFLVSITFLHRTRVITIMIIRPLFIIDHAVFFVVFGAGDMRVLKCQRAWWVLWGGHVLVESVFLFLQHSHPLDQFIVLPDQQHAVEVVYCVASVGLCPFMHFQWGFSFELWVFLYQPVYLSFLLLNKMLSLALKAL